ncbi:MAG: hypothetical protein ACOC55_01635 [Candidatus Natronoplasma sp.]
MRPLNESVRRKRFHIFLLAASLFSLLFTVLKTDPGAPEPSTAWYASSLHPAFYIGLLLCITAILLSIKYRRKYLGLVSILPPVFYLYSLPTIVHDLPPVFDQYHVIPQILSIVETGGWNMDTIAFPASHIFQANILMVLNIEALTLARLFPTILAFTIALFIFTMARKISTRWAPIAPLTFLALNWYMEYHLARQPFGMMIWTAFWLALFLYFEKQNYRLGVVTSVVLLALIPAHPGMVIITAFNLFALTLVMFISFREEEEWNYFSRFVPMLLIFGIIAALLYASIPTIGEYMTEVYQDFDRGLEEGTLELSLGGPTATSFGYGFVNQLRMLAGGFHSLLALLGLIFLYKADSKKALLLGAWFFSIYLWLSYPLTHDGLYIERAFMYSLIPASILGVVLLKHSTKKFTILQPIEDLLPVDLKYLTRIAAIVIIAAFLLTVPITKNSIDAIETPSDPAYRAGLHAESNLDDRVYVTDTHEGIFRYIETTTSEDASPTYQFRSRGKMPPDQPYGYPIPRTDRHLSPILFTDHFNNYIEIRYGNTTAVKELGRYEADVSRSSASIYDSGGARLYLQT